MKKAHYLILLFGVLIGGCATPKIGEDILIEPQGNVRLENSGTQMVFGLLTLLGLGEGDEPIRLGSDLKVVNKWHSDMRLVSLTYTLNDDQVSLANGEAKIEPLHPMIIESGKEKMIPLVFSIHMKTLDTKRVMGIIQAKRKLILRGDVVIEVWGFEHHYPFERDATKLVLKALNGV